MLTDSFHASENRGDQQWAEQRAKLVQCFMYTEGPPKPNLTTGMRQHRVARGIACRPAEAFENNQWAAIGQLFASASAGTASNSAK